MTEDIIAADKQKTLSSRVNNQLHKRLLNSINNTRDKARMNSLGLQHAGDWLHVVPSPVLGLHLRPQEFRFAMLYCLGVPIYSSEGPCVACGLPCDVRGDHLISCGAAGERIDRHNQLCDAVYHTAVSALLGPRREDRAILPGADNRPADVLLPNWSGGKDAAIDITVVNPLRKVW